ncbi:AimR family lysis-lysogeny pheromone receptor [Bacillus thuringiensis]|nr:AimR family lysis-lysogeny pheromone receptor [Bacillus thuringiensis]
MYEWIKKLKDQMNKTNRSYDSFARELDMPKSTLTDFFRYHKEISILNVYKMANTLFNGNRVMNEKCCIEVFSKYERNIKINMKRLFVFSYLNGYNSILEYLISMTSTHKDSYVKKYSPLINLFYERTKGGSPKQHILMVEEIRKSAPEKESLDMEIISDILYLLSVGDIGDFGMFDTYRKRIYQNLSIHKNQDLKWLYKYWIDDIWSYSLLRRLRIDEFNEYNNQLKSHRHLKYFPVMEATIDLRKGESLIFTDYKQSYKHSLRALNIFKNQSVIKYKIALNNINFLKLVNKEEVKTIDLNTLHPAELALYFIINNENKRAIDILLKILDENKQLSPIQYCYLGQAQMNLKMIFDSKQMFIEKGDYFFAQYAARVYREYKEVLECGGVK